MGAESSGEPVLLARLLAGDDLALGAAYDRYGQLVFGIARRVIKDEQLARDVTQEVFTHLWELPHRVDLARGSLRAYLATVAHRRAVDEVRRSERQIRSETWFATPVVEEGPEDAVVEHAARQWWSRRLATALAELPDEQRSALQLAYYGGCSYRQVAVALQISEGTAKSRMRLALARLRTALGEEMVGEVL